VRFLLLLDLAVLALLVYCLIDCIQTDSALVRNLPKPFWILLIVIVPLVGGIAWLVAGRPEGAPAATGRPGWRPAGRGPTSGYSLPNAPLGPDDDPDFLRQIRSIDEEHERTLEQWERDLRERERRLRDGEPPDDGTPPPDGTPPTAPGGPR
jgi:Phospholipase_D-nuclease N-terminal